MKSLLNVKINVIMYTTIQKIGQVVFFKEMNTLISKDRLN